jgi:membrane-associated phospholipid phosphatase
MIVSKIVMPAESSADSGKSWLARVAVLWREKLCLTVALNIVFWSTYFFLSRHALFRTHPLPMTWLDNWAGYRPYGWSWIYESNFLLVGAIPWFIVTREELRRCVAGFILLAAISFAIFVVFPVASPRPADLGTNPFMLFIAQADGPFNAFPSLHASTLIYSLALARRLFGRKLNPVVFAALIVWAALILIGTLATKQHYAIDLLAGGLIGLAADWAVWRNGSPGAIAATNTRRNNDVASQAG